MASRLRSIRDRDDEHRQGLVRCPGALAEPLPLRDGPKQALTTDDVIGHILDAFEFFGGMPEELVLDREFM